jgi:hypothetical protein
MSQSTGQAADPEIVDPGWKSLYKIGAVAALVAVVFFRRNFGTELVAFRGFGIFDVPEVHPQAAIEWFTLLQEDRLLGLCLFNLVDLVNYALVGLLFLAVYGALRRVDKGAMALATTFGFVGIGVYFASNQAFAMLSLSDRYAAATTEAQRSTFLAAGEALLAIDNPGAIYSGTGIYAALFLVLLAGLVTSIVMLRSGVFNTATAYVGILANGFGLAYFVALVLTPAMCAVPMVISAPFRVTWYVMIALRLFRLGPGGLTGKD